MTRVAGLLIAIVIAAGCDQLGWFEKFIPQEEAEFAKGYLSHFQTGDFAAIEKAIDPSLKDAQLRSKLEQMASLFPRESPKAIRVVGSQSNIMGDTTTVNLSFEYEYSSSWLLANVVLQKKAPAGILVKAVHVQPAKESLAHVNRFTFEEKGVAHYTVLAIAILVPLFIVYSVILAIRTPISKRKWLWIIFVLLGFVQMSLNWTTGDFHVNPISFQLLGASFVKPGPFAPIILSVSIPLGAIVFLLRRKKWMPRRERASGEG